MEKPPKVFVSHATEDKERFVRKFALGLRERGIDAWVDEWEIQAGDSLVDKIFEEGLKDATAFIAVISNVSISKRWVREELNAAIVRRINKGSRLIPVVLDNAEVPEALKDTVWVRVSDPDACERELEQVASAIFGISQRPPLGPMPEYVRRAEPHIDELTKVDVIVLRLFGERAVQKGYTLAISTDDRWNEVEKLGVSRQDFLDALEILTSRGFVEPSRVLAPVPPHFSVTLLGFDKYVQAFVPGYKDTVARVLLAIVNGDKRTSAELAETLSVAKIFVDHLLHVLAENGQIEITTSSGGYIGIQRVSAELRRRLTEATSG